jgi:hypothetical protein
MSVIEKDIPPFEQKNTSGVRSNIELDISISLPPLNMPNEIKVKSEELLRLAQQIVFLPHFYVTDHIFYGDQIDSDDPNEGLPSIRTAMISGHNFGLFIQLNFNRKDWEQSDTQITLYHNDEPFRKANIDVSGGVATPSTALWLTSEVLPSVRNELMLIDPQVELEY